MAEYYPLLAKAVGSLPNSTPETRRVIYERARKALIGQLRTLHPPVPEDDIERESVELDRAVQRLERELASGVIPAPALAVPSPANPVPASVPAPILPPRPPRPASALSAGGAAIERKPFAPVRSKLPSKPKSSVPGALIEEPKSAPELVGSDASAQAPVEARAITPSPAPVPTRPLPSGAPNIVPLAEPAAVKTPLIDAAGSNAGPQSGGPTNVGEGLIRSRPESQRPIAPQPASGDAFRRRTWIIPVGIGVIVLAVAGAAYKLRDTRQTLTRAKPTEQVAQSDSSKISERVGTPGSDRPARTADEATTTTTQPATTGEVTAPAKAPPVIPANPEVPVAHRAALLIEAPEEANKVKTYLGTVIWKLNNVNEGPGDGIGLAVEADVDLPDDKMNAVITFEKNTDPSLPASHTIKLRFSMQPGSLTGNIKQISVPQLRQEDSPSGEALAGVTVSVVPNSFLVGLSPGNAETVNIKQLKELQWIDVPILLDSGKIAKLTFEKGSSGERDLDEAIAAWQKS